MSIKTTTIGSKILSILLFFMFLYLKMIAISNY